MGFLESFAASPTGQVILRKKDLRVVARDCGSQNLHKTLTTSSLISLGIGSVIGAGIFVLTGQAAAKYAGPALSLSFIVSAVACFFTGLCYAELASTIPIAGSAYSYVYVSVGEGFAWAVGLCLTLEYLFSAAAVAVGWGAGLQELLREFNYHLPMHFSKSPLEVGPTGELSLSGAYFNVPSMLIIAGLTCLLCIGVKESANFNNAAVATKIGVLTTFVGYGIYYALTQTKKFEDNLDPFIPPNEGPFGAYGVSGIFRGAGAIFFAYVGFDAVCAVAQECKHPETDLPRGLMGTLVICTVFYIAVTLALTGLMDYKLLNVDSPVIESLYHVHAAPGFRYLVEIGTIAGLTSVCLVSMMSMPRVVFAIANDGLLPHRLSEIHPKYRTPVHATVITGIICCMITGLFPLDFLGELISFGTLLAFTMVCVGVLKMRKDFPDHPRPFSTPFLPWVPIGGIVTCLIQLFSLPPKTWRNCLVLLCGGMIYYFISARYKSKLNGPQPEFEEDVLKEVAAGLEKEDPRKDKDLDLELDADCQEPPKTAATESSKTEEKSQEEKKEQKEEEEEGEEKREENPEPATEEKEEEGEGKKEKEDDAKTAESRAEPSRGNQTKKNNRGKKKKK